MKLFKITVKEYHYEEFDSLIVSANSKEQAIGISYNLLYGNPPIDWDIEEIGTYNKEEADILLASFNAG